MSTDFLNRRMDLHHTVDITHSNLNVLTMDTSYPVKLAGKVIKLFDATANYNQALWEIRNSLGETILSITSASNVKDFAGRVINDNIGEDLPYGSNTDVFKNGDYVMAIIDFDNATILLCSQTNFTNFITEGIGGGGNFRLFEIDGTTQPTETDKNIEYPFDTDKFTEAAEFEAEEDKYAITRFSEDQVLYSHPTESTDERSMIPVAKLDTENINKLVAAVQTLMFPYIDGINPDTKGGIESVDKLAAFMVFNGSMTQKFLTDFCFTKAEMLSLPIVTTASQEMKDKMLEEYYNIDNPDDYRYVLMGLVDSDEEEKEAYDGTLKFIPIDQNGSFASLFSIMNRGFIVDGEKIELANSNINVSNNYGQLETNDAREGYSVYYYSSGFSVRRFEYDKYDKLVDGVIQEGGDGESHLYGAQVDEVANGMDKGKDYSYFSSDSSMTDVDKFINFFASNDDQKAYLKKMAISAMATSMSSSNGHYYTVNGDDLTVTPNTIVMLMPDEYEDEVFNTPGSTIKTYNDLKTKTFTDRTDVKYTSRISSKNHRDNMAIVFDLFNTKNTSDYVENDKSKSLKSCTMSFAPGESPVTYNIKYKYYSNRNLSTDSEVSYNYGISYNNGCVFSIVNVLSVNKIGQRDGLSAYNPAEVFCTNFLVWKKINKATEHIYVNSGDMFYCPDISDTSVKHRLYVVAVVQDGETVDGSLRTFTRNGVTYVYKPASTTASYQNFKTSGTDANGNYLYMYYDDGAKLYRLKYYYRNLGNRAVDDYDYFTMNVVMSTDQASKGDNYIKHLNSEVNKSDIYARAYVNYVATASFNYSTNDAMDDIVFFDFPAVAALVAGVYGLSLAGPPSRSGTNTKFVSFESDRLNYTSTCNLTVDIDERIIYPGVTNASSLSDHGIRLNYLLNSKRFKYAKNMMTPALSTQKDATGGTVYNMKAYINYVKNNLTAKTLSGNGTASNNTNYYANIAGIHGTVLNLTAYQFYKAALTRDLAKSMDDETAYFDSVETRYRALYKKSDVEDLKFITRQDTTSHKLKYVFYDENFEDDYPLSTENSIVLHTNINPKNMFNINVIGVHDHLGNDVSELYVADNPAWINHHYTGLRESYSLSLSNGDIFNPSLIPLTGNEGTLSVDDISWMDLLVALGNNESLDLLSVSLKNIKFGLNTNFLNQIQNVSDSITMQEDQLTIDTAADTEDPFPPDPKWDKYRQPEGTPAGEFNEDTNLYEFHYGYGYTGEQFKKYRVPNNRGVIVFVTEGGSSYMQQGSGDTYDQYENTTPDLHPKRMYMSVDGLVCSKAYFDQEAIEYTPEGGDAPVYPSSITTIASLLKRIVKLETQLNADQWITVIDMDTIDMYYFETVRDAAIFIINNPSMRVYLKIGDLCEDGKTIPNNAFYYSYTETLYNIPSSSNHFKNIEKIYFGSTTQIGNYAFYNCAKLKSVEFNKVVRIEQYAFNTCAIEELNFPETVEYIGNQAFYCQTAYGGSQGLALRKLTFAAGSQDAFINEYAFNWNETFRELEIPGNYKFKQNAFNSTYPEVVLYHRTPSECRADDEMAWIAGDNYAGVGGSLRPILDWNRAITVRLTDVNGTEITTGTIRDVIYFDTDKHLSEWMGSNSFSSSSRGRGQAYSKITYTNETCWGGDPSQSYTHGASGQLYGYKCVSLEFGMHLRTIPSYLCSGNTLLKNILFWSGVTDIKSTAFYGCTALTSISIPASVNIIEDYVFQGCTNLATISINRAQDAITGSPWSAPNATVSWTGST